MKSKRFGIVGCGKSLTDCIRVMYHYNAGSHEVGAELAIVLLDETKNWVNRGMAGYFEKNSIRYLPTLNINSVKVVDTVRKLKIDYLLSVNNHQILRRDLLNAPRNAVLNFHNGPLPKYGGVNACSWAIYNGEQRHGVTWHFMEENIDSGGIISQRHFNIPENETAIRLIMRCISEGMKLFGEILPDICRDSLPMTPQDHSKSLYYSNNDVPNGGLLDFSWTYEQLDRFMRSHTFQPFPNLLPPPGSEYEGRAFHVTRVSKVHGHTGGEPGEIVYVGGEGVRVRIGDCVVSLDEALDENQIRMSMPDFVSGYGLAPGRYFGGPAA